MSKNIKDGYERIKNMSNDELLVNFESYVRVGEESNHVNYIWMRKEILKRMDFGELV